MSNLNTVLYKLRTNRGVREHTFEKAVEAFPTVYSPDANGKLLYLRNLMEPLATPPTTAPAGTPPVMSAEQSRLCDLAQDYVDSNSAASGGISKAIIAAFVAAGVFVGANMINDIKGTEPHVTRHQYELKEKNKRWQDYNKGQDAPYNKPEDVVDQEESDNREDGKNGLEGASALAALGLAALACYLISKKKE